MLASIIIYIIIMIVLGFVAGLSASHPRFPARKITGNGRKSASASPLKVSTVDVIINSHDPEIAGNNSRIVLENERNPCNPARIICI